ncbi:uncharacterized protein [Haliotis asinina]|uniref:uncharacterized protein isoform X2 n=1 Tax=Haliotis asinina TaxID=109174 RepID=UPI003531873B
MMMMSLRLLRTLVVAALIPLLTLTKASDLPPDISGAETVVLPEDTTVSTDLGVITCIDRSLGAASDTGCSTCHISSVRPVFDGFTLLKMLGSPDFQLNFQPTTAVLSSGSYTVTVTCNGLNQVSGTWTVQVTI